VLGKHRKRLNELINNALIPYCNGTKFASCYKRRSVAITTNLEFGQWDTAINNNRLTAALIERFCACIHRRELPAKAYPLPIAYTG